VSQRKAILRLTLQRHAREMGGEDSIQPDLLPPTPPGGAVAFANVAPGGAAAAAGGLANGHLEAQANGHAEGPGANGASGEGVDGGDGADALSWLAARTEGFSGSDLVQLCSQAAAVPIQELIE
jgi:SpoVK/Ycf46/Vps4 family AAA+-type ATPase